MFTTIYELVSRAGSDGLVAQSQCPAGGDHPGMPRQAAARSAAVTAAAAAAATDRTGRYGKLERNRTGYPAAPGRGRRYRTPRQ
eukprot:472530-Hanusia_phi.AAC.1